MANDSPVVPVIPDPARIIANRLGARVTHEKHIQTAYACIGALEQSGWVIVRKRHARK